MFSNQSLMPLFLTAIATICSILLFWSFLSLLGRCESLVSVVDLKCLKKCWLIHCIVQENLKALLKYIVDSFWDQLVKFEYLASIHSLKVKYEQVNLFLWAWLAVETQAWVYVLACSVWIMVGQKMLLLLWTFVDEMMSVLWRKKKNDTLMRTGTLSSFLIILRRFSVVYITSMESYFSSIWSVMMRILLLHLFSGIRKDTSNLIYPMELLQAIHS